MTRIFLLMLAVAASTGLSAQTEGVYQALSYQAVARDANGDPLPGQDVGLQFTLTGGPGTIYSETQQVTTNAQGLFRAEIGLGDHAGWPALGNLEWDHPTHAFHLLVAADVTGGTDYQPLGDEVLRAVPFAQTARQATTLLDSAVVVKTSPKQVLVDTTYFLGVGTRDPDTTLHVVGRFKYQDGNEADGRFLCSDASGNAYWREPGFTASFGIPGSLAPLNTGTWQSDFVMQVFFFFPESREVLMSYNICTDMGSSAPFYARLALDGSPILGSNSYQAGGAIISVGASGVFTVPAGTHTVTVQYSTIATPVYDNNDYESSIFTVKVLDQ
ncbi:MAG: Ig-like domain-containing protein [Flavobacteriales bacterium]|nr:Ig-like domain-containing protein [Flavobacteriales bacterium]